MCHHDEVRSDDIEWLGTSEIARLFGCSVSLVQRTLRDPDRATATYGAGNWRDRTSPVATKRVFQVTRGAVERVAESWRYAADERPVST